MRHIHFESLNSTQEYLKASIDELLISDENIVVSTDQQTDGLGRQKHVWDFYSGSLAFSFNLKAASPSILTPLEIGVLVANFFKQLYGIAIKLKWPNDLINSSGEKCGGIIGNMLGNNQLIVGIGVNAVQSIDKQIDKYDFKAGGLDYGDVMQTKDLIYAMVEYIHESRLAATEIVTKWNDLCSHKDIMVKLVDQKTTHNGLFKGIDDQGLALIEIDNHIEKFCSGNLRY